MSLSKFTFDSHRMERATREYRAAAEALAQSEHELEEAMRADQDAMRETA